MGPTDTTPTDGIDLPLSLGFTLGLDMPFREAVEWAGAEGFDFVEGLLDGPYAREQIDDQSADMRATLADNGVDVVVLVPAARERGLVPCLENIVSTYYDATTFPELLERYPDAAMTFDTSHALLAGLSAPEMAAFCTEHANRIEHLHLVDTRKGDEHLPVGMGNIEFAPVLEALADADWRGTATLEIGTEDYDTIALGKRHVEELLGGGDAA